MVTIMFTLSEMTSARQLCQRLEDVEEQLASRQQDVKSLEQLNADLKDQIQSLRARLNTLNEVNEELLKRTFSWSEDVTALTNITSTQRFVPH